ncbi:hypothetical protein ABZ438_08040 [Streptomyces sp. NPDC005786]|uniref:hypothetical protein n=1 Tax=Streptomyces sp. NPDC005786 TaxID=3154891 RepID=UPI0033C3DF82
MSDIPMTPDREQAPWGRDEDGRPRLPMGAHWTDIPELVNQHLAGIEGRVTQAQRGKWFVPPAAATPGTVCTQYDGYTRTVGQVTNMLPADLELTLHAHSDLSWCLDLITKLRARIAELEGTPADEAAELAEGQAQLDAMRADHPAPSRVPDSPDCTRVVEYGIAVDNEYGQRVLDPSPDRAESMARLARCQQMWPNSRLVQRTVSISNGEWTEVTP